MEKIGDSKCFGGWQQRFSHRSDTLDCDMTFSVYLPPQVDRGLVPVLYWLSGLTCTDENFVTKAGAQRYASEYGIALVVPDTSPRGEGVADDAEGAYDLGLGAGFYVNATREPWHRHYRMYDYVMDELPALVEGRFPVDSDRVAISGHSMGGHGALIIALKNPGRFKSISVFAPICSPMRCSWGEKALSQYLGENRDNWRQYDATELLAQAAEKTPLRVEQGTADPFLEEQLKTELLAAAGGAHDYPMDIRYREGYDHSYFFIASFIEEHLRFHARHLCVNL